MINNFFKTYNIFPSYLKERHILIILMHINQIEYNIASFLGHVDQNLISGIVYNSGSQTCMTSGSQTCITSGSQTCHTFMKFYAVLVNISNIFATHLIVAI